MADKFELNSTTPAAPSGMVNITWQLDANGNTSGYVDEPASLMYTSAERENTSLPRQTVIRFSGAGVTVTDNPSESRTEVYIPGGGSGSSDWDSITNKPPTFPPSAHTHAAADVTSGVFAVTRLGTGTPSAETYLRGDGAWAAVPASGGSQTPWTSDIDAAGFALNNTGSVGINTATPGALLDIKARTNAVDTLMIRSAEGSKYFSFIPESPSAGNGALVYWNAGAYGTIHIPYLNVITGFTAPNTIISGRENPGKWAIAYTGPGKGYDTAALEIRESGGGFGSTDANYRPRIGFHWGGRFATQLGLDTDNIIAVFDNPGTGLGGFRAAHYNGLSIAEDMVQPGAHQILRTSNNNTAYLGTDLSVTRYAYVGSHLNCPADIPAGAPGYVAGRATGDAWLRWYSVGTLNDPAGAHANAVPLSQCLIWKVYGTGHVIFDASASTAPNGAAVNRDNAAAPWASTYPNLMGWNGSTTYGVRVDSARYADSAGSAGSVSMTRNDVKASRLLGSSYTNSTGRMMFIAVTVNCVNANSGIGLIVGGVTVSSVVSPTVGAQLLLTGWIPNGASYMVSGTLGPTVLYWMEYY